MKYLLVFILMSGQIAYGVIPKEGTRHEEAQDVPPSRPINNPPSVYYPWPGARPLSPTPPPRHLNETVYQPRGQQQRRGSGCMVLNQSY